MTAKTLTTPEIEAFMESADIHKIARWPAGRWSVALGADTADTHVGRSIAEALKKAAGARA